MGEITARLRGAEVGDFIDLESLDGSRGARCESVPSFPTRSFAGVRS